MTDPSSLAPLLLAWYDRCGRTLPWRGGSDLYPILVSELMLQQTRVDTALRYFEPFLERFPSVEALAQAPEEEVMAAWSGLGFYRRARNLHAAAIRIVEEHGGCVPTDPAALQDLPGVGRYTAGAILSSGLNARLPILDGNVIRVLTRVFSIGEPPDRAATQRQLWQLAEEVLPEDRPGDFNQAIMDLGATLCRSQSPDCPTCPFQEHCGARAEGAVEDYPRPGRKTRVKLEERVAVLLMGAGDRFLLRKRPPGGLLGSLWELPSSKVEDNEAPEVAAARTVAAQQLSLRGTVEHRFSHRHWTIRVFRGASDDTTPGEDRGAGEDEVWVKLEDLSELGIPTVTRKTIEVALAAD